MPVNRERIVIVALDLLDENGLAGLTLRELAGRLGIRAPTLYWHVRDKRELLDLLAAAILDEALAAWRTRRPSMMTPRPCSKRRSGELIPLAAARSSG
jgi:TetR/AcrR family tetracycline transcriptional repressor